MKRRLHNAIAEALNTLREEGTELIVNLKFYEIVKKRVKFHAPSNHSIALYLIRHRNEFMVRFDEKHSGSTHGAKVTWRNILLLSPESYYGSKKAVPKFAASMSKVV